MPMKEVTTGTAIARSLILHGAAFLAMATAPSLKMMPEGTVQTTEVEIVNLQAPKGQQVQTMKPESLSQAAPAAAAKAPKIDNAVVIPKAKKLAASVPAPPPKASPKNQRAQKNPAPEMKDLQGTVTARMQKEESEKIRKELEAMREEMQRSKLAEIARQEVEEQQRKEREKQREESLSAALAQEREKYLEAQKEREQAQKAALAAALAQQKAEMDERNAALSKELEEQKAAQAAALAKANKVIEGQGSQISNLQNKNQQLVAKNEGMSRAMKENLAYGLPSGTRDVRHLRQVSGNVPPQYPYDDRLKNNQGQVLVHYYVTPQGHVSNIRVVKSSGYSTLDREALRALSQYRFYPGQQGSTKHWVNFSLTGKAQSLTGGLKTQ
ncbi:MAG: TonB family protein [Bdellovibrionales bacterium]|nr:TonB family protein [Bdellovibrionales bacterium]